MNKKLVLIMLVALLLPFAASAKAIGPSVSKYRGTELKWEDGAYGYHVMFKSLLENKEADSDPNNPQADTCKDSSTYTLDLSHIPSDAIIEDAYLIWTSAVPVAKRNDPTDNTVNFSFMSEDGKISENQEIKGKKAYKVEEAGVVDFEFDAFRDADDTNKAWYTYRTKITDFFKSIQEKGRAGAAEGSKIYDGYSLLGQYTLSGLECTNDAVYKGTTEMVADWSVVMIYTSTEISPKKIYMYDGFKAYWHELSEINVTGFEFPIDPEIRLTLASHEGDPGLWTVEPPNGILVPEGIQVQGDAPDWLLISNKCNPPAYGNNGFTFMDYVEIFNSISSVYGYADTTETCIGGEPGALNYEAIEYGIDVDTFVMDSYTDGSYAAHFNKGGQQIKLRIGANQDSAITNYMIVSVDTKAPQFDIPGQPEKVACTPANVPTDPNSLEGKWCQSSIEHTFAMRIQNWGSDFTNAVIVKDSIPVGMEYVPGSTEYANEFVVENNKKIAKKWIPIPDDGGFPLENGVKVADSLNFCQDGDDYLSCSDLVIVRFRAKVKADTPKNQIIENTATFKSAGVSDYRTNLGIPVKLRMVSSGCVSSQDAVDLSDCGGTAAAVTSCEKDKDCGAGFVCDKKSHECVEDQNDPSNIKCSEGTVKVAVGKNSPSSETTFIGNPQNGLVIGQLELSKETAEDCSFNLDQLRLKIDVKDQGNIKLTNIKMYNDVDGNGKVDDGDVLLGSESELLTGHNDVSFTPASPANKLKGNKKNYVLFVVDAAYAEGKDVTPNSSFSASVEDGGVILSNQIATTGLPVNFNKFQFEPKKGFMIGKGPHDPAVPAKAQMNGTHDVLQLRVLAKGGEDTLKKMKIKVPKSTFASFGSGISRLAVYEDTNNDGKGDTEIASTTEFDSTTQHQFTLNFATPADTEKYLTIRADLSLSDGETFQIQVSNVTVANFSDNEVYGTPVTSQPYAYVCEGEECGDDDGGCSMTTAEDSSSSAIYAALLAMAALAAAFVFKRSQAK